MRSRALGLIVVVGIAGGCGSAATAPATPDPAAADAQVVASAPVEGQPKTMSWGPADGTEAIETEAELSDRQERACDALCERLTACALEDLERAEISAEERAQTREAAPEHTRVCREACSSSALSPRQVRVHERCLAADAKQRGCRDMVRCTQPSGTPAAVSPGGN